MKHTCLLFFVFSFSLVLASAQIPLQTLVINFEIKNDTLLSDCFKKRLDTIYLACGSPKIKIGRPHFWPGKIFIKDSSDLLYLVNELSHAYQWRQKGGRLRLPVAFGWQVTRAFWLSLWKSRDCERCKRTKKTFYERYRDTAYENKKKFWSFEYQAHYEIAPEMWFYLSCRSPNKTK